MMEGDKPMNHDTQQLLRECSAGIDMAVRAIDDVAGQAKDAQMQNALLTCRKAHQALEKRTTSLLREEDLAAKPANAMARSMAWLKSSAKLAMMPEDATIADLMTDGCNMGIKSLLRYRNRYAQADEQARKIAGELIDAERQLCRQMEQYL